MIARGSCERSWTRLEYLHQGDEFGFGKRRASAGLGGVGMVVYKGAIMGWYAETIDRDPPNGRYCA